MRSFGPRFPTPLDSARPRGAPLLEGFSPKLGRRIRLFDRATFDQWIRLKADPTVLLLCERPLRLSPDVGSRVVDFWLRRDDGEQLLPALSHHWRADLWAFAHRQDPGDLTPGLPR